MTRQDGVVTTELVLLVPVLLVLLAFVVMTGRVGETRGAVTHAAQQAARAASLHASPQAAREQAQTVAAANLDALGVACRELAVTVDTTRFHAGGEVAVDVTCTADLADVSILGLPASRTVTSQAVEVIDTFRGATPR